MNKNIKFENVIDDFGGDKSYKVEFLNNMIKEGYSKNSARQLMYLFKNSKELENKLNKDLYDFTEQELEEYFKSLRIPKINSLQSAKSSIDKYIDTSIKDLKSIYRISPTTNIKRSKLQELILKEVDVERFCTKNELYRAMTMLENFTDMFLILCIWKGLYNSEYTTIRNIKESDFDRDSRVLNVFDYNINSVKKLQLDDMESMICKQAIAEQSYVKGENEYDYLNSEYIMKTLNNIRKKNEENETIKSQMLRDRIRQFQEESKLSFVTGTTINLSGWIYRLLEEQGYDKEYSHKDVLQFISDNKLRFNYINFYDSLLILQKKYKLEKQC